jgi:hypothetical protein
VSHLCEASHWTYWINDVAAILQLATAGPEFVWAVTVAYGRFRRWMHARRCAAQGNC